MSVSHSSCDCYAEVCFSPIDGVGKPDWNTSGATDSGVSFSPSYSGALIACDGNDTNSRKGPFILTQNNGGNYISQRILYYDATTAGQVELWRFLLELLTDWRYREYIYWVSDDGEFKLSNPEEVASMWGHRKNKPAMNYEKLSRALRYYYDGDMISKVSGFYRFAFTNICHLSC
ncbi:unnamed protein product [Trichobilharzia regenti]|nr:unnamed protein product [Trichobilharzia regenti]